MYKKTGRQCPTTTTSLMNRQMMTKVAQILSATMIDRGLRGLLYAVLHGKSPTPEHLTTLAFAGVLIDLRK
ncbi:MAG: hypothetical protein WCO71_02885 [Pseudomonadota bacterium]